MRTKIKQNYSMARIAAELNTSKTVVSFVINGKARSKNISAKTIERVNNFCKEVGYHPNIHAQRMNNHLVKNIGILIQKTSKDNEAPFCEYNTSRIVSGIAEMADAAGYRFSFQFYSKGMDNKNILEWFRSKEIDGLIYYGFEMPNEWIQIFKDENFKVAGISTYPSDGIPCVNVDNYDAACKLTEHLIKQGHQNFLYLSGELDTYPGRKRYEGFKDTLKKANISLPEDNFFEADFNREKAVAFIEGRLQDGRLKEDVIVCANDSMAVGVIEVLNKAGIKIPEQIAVVGADNINLSRFITPSLTTFDYLPLEQGKAAFELLHNIIIGCPKPENIVFKTKLCLRDSG